MRVFAGPLAVDESPAKLSGDNDRPRECCRLETKSAVILRLHDRCETVQTVGDSTGALTNRDRFCNLCENLVCLKLDVSLEAVRSKTRSCADVALARQIAMYLAHTTFSVLMTEVGLHFNRDRTTVRHACATVEDRRDEFAFDTMICQLEDALKQVAETIEPERFEAASTDRQAERSSNNEGA